MSKTKEFVKKGLLAIGYELKKKRSLVATPIKTRIIESFVSNGSNPGVMVTTNLKRNKSFQFWKTKP